MTTVGWEFFGIKFSMFITMLASAVAFLGIWLATYKNNHFGHVDNMAGDEGED